jgi:hypothetical protein
MVRDLDMRTAEVSNAGYRTSARCNPAQTVIAWVMGGFATLAALVLGSILAVVFAATLAVILVLAAGLLTLGAVAWRLRRPRRLDAPVIEARKIGHSWIAYGWDQRA